MDLKVGIEVHQQLATDTKLFCDCPTFVDSLSGQKSKDIDKLFPVQFRRRLRAVASEMGEIDIAAKFESRHEILVRYFANAQSSCLVEADEEPPHPINQRALDTSILFGLTLGSKIVDEIHVMRKIVVDGSNTSGFQRTALVAVGGELNCGQDGFAVGVQSICVEEDAARTLQGNSEGARSYALDRLGTPLVEVALAPIKEANPDKVAIAALTLGRLLRSTGRVARGLGTVRQDLNVSVMNGKVVEVKGVQQLNLVSKVVHYEALRQKFLMDLALEIRRRTGERVQTSTTEVTDLFAKTQARVISSLLANNSNIVDCILIKNFSGFISKENSLHYRLGKELGAMARAYGLGGVFHSDELPNYGITKDEVESVIKKIGAEPGDAFVLVAGPSERVKLCIKALILRIEYTPSGVPAETRAATAEAETKFLRPRPGSARMYPETDIPLEIVNEERLDRLAKIIPTPWEIQIKNFQEKYELPLQLAEQMYDSDRKEIFERIVENNSMLSPKLVASVLLDGLQMLEREGVAVDDVNTSKLLQVFKMLGEGRFAKEAITNVMKWLSEHPDKEPEQALGQLGFSAMSLNELEEIVRREISKNMSILRTKGAASQSVLMGNIMRQVRGRIDGKIVSQTLDKQLKSTLEEMGRI
jgi:glutamyl-tRNA(Gln) amidotransferase subunit E